MYKHIGFLTKRAEQPFADLVNHWQTAHADLARQLPGLRRYVLNPIDRTAYPDSPVDGCAELWFDADADAEAAWASAAGTATAADAQSFLAGLVVVDLHEITIR
jgi:uncharacterized protein (TIGR02118 family)